MIFFGEGFSQKASWTIRARDPLKNEALLAEREKSRLADGETCFKIVVDKMEMLAAVDPDGPLH